MKRTFICLLAAFAVATSAVSAAQAGATEVTASGTGSVSMQPDLAILDVSVETNAPSASDATTQNNARYDRIVAAIAKLGIARTDIALTYYNVSFNPPPRVTQPTSSERYGYTVSRNFSVKVREIGAAGRVSDSCTSAGATAINGVSFGLADPTTARREAATKAVAEARANAEGVAAAAGLRIVGIKSIDLGGGGPGPVPMMRMAASAPNAPTQFDQSNVNVTVSVSVVFLAEP